MIIKDIQHIKNGQTRTDGNYPNWIGCAGYFYSFPVIGHSILFAYTKDNKGKEMPGAFLTSVVRNIKQDDNTLVLETLNSRYIFKYNKEERLRRRNHDSGKGYGNH